jgi:hypothetical protein
MIEPPLHDLEARAVWHLGMGYAPEPAVAVFWTPDDADQDVDFGDEISCPHCDGGTVMNCIDDLCHGQGWCMHGDEDVCRHCHGEGVIPR